MSLTQNLNGGRRSSVVEEPRKSTQESIYENVKNPYKDIVTPQLGWFQRVLDMIGITNTAEQNRYQQELAANQWDSEFARSQADIEYNNPINQAQLMREAGINPDLNGLSQFEANSANSANSMQPDLSPNNSAVEGFKNIGNAIVEGFKMYIGASEGIINISDKIFEHQKKIFETAEKEAESAFARIQRDKIGSVTSIQEEYNWKTNPYFSHIQNKRVKKAAQSYLDKSLGSWQAAAKELYKQEKDFYVSRNESAEEKTKYGSIGFKPNDLDFIDILAEYNNLRINAMKAAERNKISDAEWNMYENQVYYGEGFFRNSLKQEQTGRDYDNRLKKFNIEVQKKQMEFYEFLSKSDVGNFVLFNILNQSGSNLIGDLVSGGMRAIPQTRKFIHTRR